MIALLERVRARGGEDRGSAAIEAAIVAPLLIIFVCMAIAAGRLVVSAGKIDATAEDAARAASLQRTSAAALHAASAAADRSLDDQGIACRSRTVHVDTASLSTPLGQSGSVTAIVTCTVALSDLLLPGAPGSTTLTSRFTSVVDPYRSREN